jgi:hypothetical protein
VSTTIKVYDANGHLDHSLARNATPVARSGDASVALDARKNVKGVPNWDNDI